MAIANGTSSTTTEQNPHFDHIDRAPYELGYLLRNLPPDVNPHQKHSEETYLIADAAKKHASNSLDAIVHGLVALGSIMTTAGCNDEGRLDQSTVISLGQLVQHIGLEIQLFSEIEHSMNEIVRSRNQHTTN
jgi:hypothetical protein